MGVIEGWDRAIRWHGHLLQNNQAKKALRRSVFFSGYGIAFWSVFGVDKGILSK